MVSDSVWVVWFSSVMFCWFFSVVIYLLISLFEILSCCLVCVNELLFIIVIKVCILFSLFIYFCFGDNVFVIIFIFVIVVKV